MATVAARRMAHSTAWNRRCGSRLEWSKPSLGSLWRLWRLWAAVEVAAAEVVQVMVRGGPKLGCGCWRASRDAWHVIAVHTHTSAYAHMGAAQLGKRLISTQALQWLCAAGVVAGINAGAEAVTCR